MISSIMLIIGLGIGRCSEYVNSFFIDWNVNRIVKVCSMGFLGEMKC